MNHSLSVLGLDAKLKDDLGHKTHVHLGPAITLRVPRLAAVAFGLNRSYSQNPELRQGILHGLKPLRIDGRLDHFHNKLLTGIAVRSVCRCIGGSESYQSACQAERFDI